MAIVLVPGCVGDALSDPTDQGDSASRFRDYSEAQDMQLTSRAFRDGDRLSDVFTVAGEDSSPPLAWSNSPADVRSFAIICDDPDAPSARNPEPEPWVDWILFNIRAATTEISAGIGSQ